MCAELLAKIEDDDDDEPEECLEFWHNRRKELPTLFKLAMKVHAVPATSAAVERVFSHGGIIMRPHRARMGDKTLSNIFFLKCNKMGEWLRSYVNCVVLIISDYFINSSLFLQGVTN